jgi:hypothetical protein
MSIKSYPNTRSSSVKFTGGPLSSGLYEMQRLQVLKQTNIIDTFTEDPEYDRFSLLASRILKVRPLSIK